MDVAELPRARVVLNEIAKDPGRSMIVIDPVVTDTAKMADFHLRVQPGCDAWCLAALAAVLVQENLCNEAFLAAHVHGVDTVRAALQEVPVADYAQRCGWTRSCCVPRPGASAPPRACRCSKTWESSRRPTAPSAPI